MPTFGQFSRSLLTPVVSAGLAFAIGTTTACLGPTGPTDRVTADGLRYTSAPSELSATPLVLLDSIVITNVSRHTISFSYGGCVVSMRAYRSADRSGTPVYNQAAHQACLANLNGIDLAPGAGISFVGSLSAAGMQAAGVPPGHYWFTSVLLVNDEKIELAAGDANVNL